MATMRGKMDVEATHEPQGRARHSLRAGVSEPEAVCAAGLEIRSERRARSDAPYQRTRFREQSTGRCSPPWRGWGWVQSFDSRTLVREISPHPLRRRDSAASRMRRGVRGRRSNRRLLFAPGIESSPI